MNTEEKDKSEKTNNISTEFARELLSKELYILLSPSQADMMTGYSFPYTSTLAGQRLTISVFSDINLAKLYIDRNNLVKIESTYLIGKIDPLDKFVNLKNIFGIALQLGINLVSVDGEQLYAIDKIFETLDIKPFSCNYMLNAAESKAVQEGKLKKENMPVRFNPHSIIGFTNPYMLTDKEMESLMEYVSEFNCNTLKDSIEYYSKLSLHECYAITQMLQEKILPQAIKEKKKEMQEFITTNLMVIAKVTLSKLEATEDIFTIENPANGKIHTQAGVFYLIYTNRYQNQSPYKYVKLKGLNEVKELVKSLSATNIALTDGPSIPAIIPSSLLTSRENN